VKRLTWFVALLAIVLLSADAVSAQKGESKLRTVHGTVVNKDENPIASALVFLKNTRTQAVQTRITDETGRYRFSGLDPNVDYEIHAEHEDLTSSKRTLSSFDSRKEIDITLKVDKKKTEK
jgi:protocatechuate 3,4-dioxygenase beta subunit